MTMKKSFGTFETAVFPVCPIFENDGLSLSKTVEYAQYLVSEGARCLMTTAGTSQFNLLSPQEIKLMSLELTNHINVPLIIGVPPVNNADAKRFISLFPEQDNVYMMLLYPDRYYDDLTIIDYFDDLANYSRNPCFFHGMFMRSGTGGTYNYTADLISKIAQNTNIVGMKEETQTIDAAYNVCKDLPDDFEIIVAGKSQRRLLALMPTKATNFLAGVGSIYPEIDNEAFLCFKDGDMTYLNTLVGEVEEPFFDVFMKIGWHRALREAISMVLFNGEDINRRPFPDCSDEEKNLIRQTLQEVSESYESAYQ